MKNRFRKFINKFGVDISRYPSLEEKNKSRMFKHLDIDVIFDVGANEGQYAMGVMELGFKGRIISFEPTSSAYSLLKQNALERDNWSVVNMALGSSNGDIEINIAENSQSSSILEIMPVHLNAAPESKYIRKEKIRIARLDSIWSEHAKDDERILLKIDTQGFEKQVLEGAGNRLNAVTALQLEMSLEKLYENETLFLPMVEFLENKGFKLFSIDGAFTDDKTGQMLQVDGFFVKS